MFTGRRLTVFHSSREERLPHRLFFLGAERRRSTATASSKDGELKILYLVAQRLLKSHGVPGSFVQTDPAAIVSAIPFDQAWELVSNPNEKEYGGLFQLQASRRQVCPPSRRY